MLSDEEKKAVENVEKFVYSILNGISAYDCKVVLNLIEKQSKEIEELKDIKQKICNEELLEQEYVKENFIHKDKIRKMLQELKDRRNKQPVIGYWSKKAMLEKLLKEE